MDSPFQYGKAVADKHFVGRKKEVERLTANLTNGINTILISPRRWGKTSLVKRCKAYMTSSRCQVVFMDIYACRNEYEFYNMFAKELVRQTSSHIDELYNTLKELLGRIVPKIAIKGDPTCEYSLSLDITPKNYSAEEILSLPQQIAQRKGINLIVCIDEFQQIGDYENSLTLQKKMRSIWQHQEDVTYCLFGSKRHLLQSMFQNSNYPFYRFGDIMSIGSIDLKDWVPYIQQGFAINDKEIDAEMVAQICESVKRCPAYIQQLAWLTLVGTTDTATDEVLTAAIENLIDENSALYIAQTETLTSYQMNFLRAICDGKTTKLGDTATREEYHLGSYSNISRIKTALEERELITIEGKQVEISDPVLELWLKRMMM